MKFSFWALGAPLLLMILDGLFQGFDTRHFHMDALGWFAGFWFVFGFPCIFLYWLVRLVRYAWNGKPTPAAPADDSGRVFGRLN